MRVRVRHFAAALVGVLAILATPTTSALAQDDELPDGPGKDELLEACTQCHAQGLVIAQRRAPEEWSEIVTRMVGFGATVSTENQKKILAYLNANYGKESTTAAASNAASPASADVSTAGKPH